MRERVVTAAARLLREHGEAGVTTRGVAHAAGVQAPTIYRLFGDKDGLLDAVAEHVLAQASRAKAVTVEAARAAGKEPVEELRAGWEQQLEFSLANPALVPLLTSPERALRSPAVQLGNEVLRARIRRVAAAGRLKVSEARAFDLIRATGTGTVIALLATPPEARDPELGRAVIDAVFQAILGGRDGRTPGDPRAAARGAAVTLRAFVSEAPDFSAGERQLFAEWLDRLIGSG